LCPRRLAVGRKEAIRHRCSYPTANRQPLMARPKLSAIGMNSSVVGVRYTIEPNATIDRLGRIQTSVYRRAELAQLSFLREPAWLPTRARLVPCHPMSRMH